jgi:hypothetical protein
MYTNINTQHAIHVIQTFLESNLHLTEKVRINITALITGLKIVMKNNIFKFGNTFWWQLTGTAMGTPAAPSYATLYYYIHESTFIHLYPELQYYCRYLDDTLCVWLPNNDENTNTQRYQHFQNAMQGFGVLEWTFTALHTSVDFLDLTIYQNRDGYIGTTLYEKALNSYLYLPPHSAHAPGVLTGLINGMITRIARLITHRPEINQHIQNFYTRLLHRGYKPHVLQTLFNNTIDRLNITLSNIKQRSLYTSSLKISDSRNRDVNQDSGRHLMLHLTYSPNDPSSSEIQRLFRDTILSPPHDSIPVGDIRNRRNARCNINRLIIAYSRTHNISNLVSIRKLPDLNAPVTDYT